MNALDSPRFDREPANEVEALLRPWPGRYGGLPPFNAATPGAIHAASLIAIEEKRAEVAAIVASAAAATFENTILALEDSGRALKRLNCLRNVFNTTMASDDMSLVQEKIARAVERLEDEIAQDYRLHARVEAVAAQSDHLDHEQRRLCDVMGERFRLRGAGLAPAAQRRLVEVNGELAVLMSRFGQNLVAEERETAAFFQSAAELDGLSAGAIEAAAQAAADRARPGEWAIPNVRRAVWPVLTHCKVRTTRRKVREQWMSRGSRADQYDNRAILAKILRLRGEKARLLGFRSFAHLACAARAAKTPEAALDQLLSVWKPVRRKTLERLAEMQAIADADGLGGPIEACDWQYYAERLRERRLGLDAQELRPYLALENVLAALFEAARTLHGLDARELADAPVAHPEIRVFEFSLAGKIIGLVYFDLLSRVGKMGGSWQSEYRAYERFKGVETIVLSGVCTSLERTGEAVLMGWEHANVLFHEFGHAMHMLLGRAQYLSLGSIEVAWDLIEVPSQLNERWLYDRKLLRKHMRHFRTGEPIPEAMIDAIEASMKHDRVFSVGLEYLCSAVVDLRLHMTADGGDVDVRAVEERVRDELAMPGCVDEVMRAPHCWHAFAGDQYAAGLYVYLWADVMVADIVQAFERAPGGLYDAEMARRWREGFMEVGNAAPEAFRNLMGRDPDPMALLRRFDLAPRTRA